MSHPDTGPTFPLRAWSPQKVADGTLGRGPWPSTKVWPDSLAGGQASGEKTPPINQASSMASRSWGQSPLWANFLVILPLAVFVTSSKTVEEEGSS